MRTTALLLLLLPACSGLADLKRGDLEVSPAVILSAGHSDDPELDEPLNRILETRVLNGFTRMDDQRTIQAIRALSMRRSERAIPLLEQLIFDPVGDVQIQALAALEETSSFRSLPMVARSALGATRPATKEQAYHTFTVLSGVQVNFLDERELRRVLEQTQSSSP